MGIGDEVPPSPPIHFSVPRVSILNRGKPAGATTSALASAQRVTNKQAAAAPGPTVHSSVTQVEQGQAQQSPAPASASSPPKKLYNMPTEKPLPLHGRNFTRKLLPVGATSTAVQEVGGVGAAVRAACVPATTTSKQHDSKSMRGQHFLMNNLQHLQSCKKSIAISGSPHKMLGQHGEFRLKFGYLLPPPPGASSPAKNSGGPPASTMFPALGRGGFCRDQAVGSSSFACATAEFSSSTTSVADPQLEANTALNGLRGAAAPQSQRSNYLSAVRPCKEVKQKKELEREEFEKSLKELKRLMFNDDVSYSTRVEDSTQSKTETETGAQPLPGAAPPSSTMGLANTTSVDIVGHLQTGRYEQEEVVHNMISHVNDYDDEGLPGESENNNENEKTAYSRTASFADASTFMYYSDGLQHEKAPQLGLGQSQYGSRRTQKSGMMGNSEG
eukprot:g19640.t1